MKTLTVIALLFATLSTVASARSTQRIAIRVSPAMAFAPAVLTVRTTIEPSEDNRVLSIEIDSSGYHRRSDIPLDGKSSPRFNVFEAKEIPTGLYEVRAVLVGPNGPMAKCMQLVKVEPAAGHTQ
jgi:hypothetical protein